MYDCNGLKGVIKAIMKSTSKEKSFNDVRQITLDDCRKEAVRLVHE